jgi:hypothetical protein
MPERPLPLNRPKIPNADIVGTRSNQYKNNIVMGRQLAGSIFMAPLSISAYVNFMRNRIKLMTLKTGILRSQ